MRTSDHPLAERLRILSPAETAGWVIGDRTVEQVSDAERKAAFQSVARDIVKTDRERRRHGFSVDTGGAIRRALEWAFKAGGKVAGKDGEAFIRADERRKHEAWLCARFSEWLKENPRRDATTAFTAGPLRDLARDVEDRLREGGA